MLQFGALLQPTTFLGPLDTHTATLVSIGKWSSAKRRNFICRDEWTKQFADLGEWNSPTPATSALNKKETVPRLTSSRQYRRCSNAPVITGPHTHFSSEGWLRGIPMSHSSTDDTTAAQDADHRGLCRHRLRYSPNGGRRSNVGSALLEPLAALTPKSIRFA